MDHRRDVRQKQFAEVVGSSLGGPLPEDIELAYPWLGFDLVEDVYEERTNQDQIERTEECCSGCAQADESGMPESRWDPIATRSC